MVGYAPKKSRSLFTSAATAANAAANARSLANTPGVHPKLVSALAYAGCHNPVFMSSDLSVSHDTYEEEKALAEKIGSTIAALLTQACEDIGRGDIRVASVVWKDKSTGRWKNGLAIGRDDKEKPMLTDFPSQQVVGGLLALRKEVVGKDADLLSANWQITIVEEEGKGLAPTYKWEATDERGKKLQGLAANILHLQDAKYTFDTTGEHPVLLAPKADVEQMAASETASLRR